MNNIVYCLLCPDTQEVRYVGKSSKGLVRPRQHLIPSSYTKSNSHKNCWIRSLVKQDKLPVIHILSTHSCEEEAYQAEVDYIKLYRHLGAKLTNYNKGGRGGEGGKASLESRQKMSESKKGKKNPFYGKTHTKEIREKMSKERKGLKPSEATKKKMSETHKRIQNDPEIKARRRKTFMENKNKKKTGPKSVAIIAKRNNLSVIFSSVKAAHKSGYSQSCVYSALKNKFRGHNKYKQFRWYYL